MICFGVLTKKKDSSLLWNIFDVIGVPLKALRNSLRSVAEVP